MARRVGAASAGGEVVGGAGAVGVDLGAVGGDAIDAFGDVIDAFGDIASEVVGGAVSEAVSDGRSTRLSRSSGTVSTTTRSPSPVDASTYHPCRRLELGDDRCLTEVMSVVVGVSTDAVGADFSTDAVGDR